jgi:AcrR family transcriptional regulator
MSASEGNGRGGARAQETAARKARLLAAATELAREGGYDAVQMRDVAARAEVAMGTLYRHYSSKDQLLLAALLDQSESLRTRLQQRPPTGTTSAERVASVLRQACRALERDPRVTAAMVGAMFSSEPDAIEVKRKVRDELHGIIAAALDGDGDAGGRDVDAVVDVLGGVWMSSLAFWAGGLTEGAEMVERLERATQLVLG